MFIENSPLLLQPGGVVHLTRWVRSLLGWIPPLMPKFLGLFSNMGLITPLASCFFMSAGAGATFPLACFLFDILDGWKREAHLFLLKKKRVQIEHFGSKATLETSAISPSTGRAQLVLSCGGALGSFLCQDCSFNSRNCIWVNDQIKFWVVCRVTYIHWNTKHPL